MKTKKIFEFIVQSMLILSVVFFYGCGGNGNEDPDPQMNDDENNGNPNTLTIKSLEPGSPGMLSSMQPIFVEFDYDIVEDDEVQIAVVPYFDGDQFSDFYTWLVPVSMGKGSGGNFVTVGPGGAEVDQIALLIRNESNTSTIETFLFDADYTFTDGDDAMYVVRINPESPITLTPDDDLDVAITYTFTGVQDLLWLDAELYFEGGPVSEPYGIFNTSVDPAEHGPDLFGGTTLTLVSNSDETFHVDQIRIFASDGDDLLFEDLYDVEITWSGE